MKIRSDYVTNSSSSCFIIAYRNMPNYDADTLKKYPILKMYPKLIEVVLDEESNYETDSAIIFSTKEEYDEYFMECFGYKGNNIQEICEEDEDLEEEYNTVIEYINHGYTIAVKEIGYGDETLVSIVETLEEDNDNFVVLVKEQV